MKNIYFFGNLMSPTGKPGFDLIDEKVITIGLEQTSSPRRQIERVHVITVRGGVKFRAFRKGGLEAAQTGR